MTATVRKNKGRERERELAELLVSLLAGNPPWRVVEQGEAPDFLLERGDDCVGLEVTELFRSGGPRTAGSRDHATEVLRKEVARRTERRWIEQDLPPIHARLSFTGGQDLIKRDVARVVESLVRVAEARLPPAGGEVALAYDPRSLPTFPREVGSLTLRRPHEITSAEWLPSYAGWLDGLSPQTVQQAIDEKEKNRERYQTRTPVVWLLLAVDGFWLSGTFDQIDSAAQQVYQNGFGQVFLLDRHTPRLWRLRLSDN